MQVPIYLMKLNLIDLSPFTCNLRDLNGTSFKRVRKRQLMTPFTVFYVSREIMQLTRRGDFFCFNYSDLSIDKT